MVDRFGLDCEGSRELHASNVESCVEQADISQCFARGRGRLYYEVDGGSGVSVWVQGFAGTLRCTCCMSECAQAVWLDSGPYASKGS